MTDWENERRTESETDKEVEKRTKKREIRENERVRKWVGDNLLKNV